MENLIIKYLNNNISAAELDQLREWLEDSDNRTKFKNYVKIQNNLNKAYQSAPKDGYKNINKRINAKQRKSNFPFYLKIAAAFIVSLGVLSLSYFTFFKQDQSFDKQDWVKLELFDGNVQFIKPGQNEFTNKDNHFTVSQESLIYSNSDTENETEVKYNSLTVPKGKTFVVVLSDGTKITLNSGSSLRYPTVINKYARQREVYLNGEAFFEVEHEKDLPFIVHTENLNIRVLGTEFNLSAYKEDQLAYAVLINGKIQAENPNDNSSLDVSPGYKVCYKDGFLQTEKVAVEKYITWINGELLFIDDSFQVIKHKLERKYDLEITNEYEALDDIIITARFNNETIEQVLETFKAYKSFDYIQMDNRIIISEPKNKNSLE